MPKRANPESPALRCCVFTVEGIMGACAGFGIMALVGWHPVGILFGAMLGAAHVWAAKTMWRMDHDTHNKGFRGKVA